MTGTPVQSRTDLSIMTLNLFTDSEECKMLYIQDTSGHGQTRIPLKNEGYFMVVVMIKTLRVLAMG